MKSKRGSNKIYYYIDLFFILLPILMLIALYIGWIVCIKFNFNDINYSEFSRYSRFWEYISSYWTQFNDWFGQLLDGGYTSNTIFGIIYNFIDGIFSWFNPDIWDVDYTIYSFIEYYFIYLIFYEFFSLFINIIMWLPRWARNKVRDWNGSDSV